MIGRVRVRRAASTKPARAKVVAIPV